MKKQQGGLLIEVMISMAIGIFLMYGTLQVMLITKENYLARQALSVVDKNGRLIMDMLTSDIRMAGYRGCASNSQTISIGVSSLAGYYDGAALDINEGIRGWEYTGTGQGSTLTYADWLTTESFNSTYWQSGGRNVSDKALVAKDSGTDFTFVKESDVFRVWSIEPYVAEMLSATSGTLTVASDTLSGFPSGSDDRLLIVSDCEKSILVKAVNFSSGGLITLDDTVTSVTSELADMENAQVVLLRMVQYSLEFPGHSSRPSLYRRELDVDGDFKNRVEVLPSVMNMQLLYGENLDSDPDADAYITADNITDWEKVVSVRLWLMVENETDNVIPETMSASHYGSSYSTNDNRARQGFTKTIVLRNRMLGETE